MHAAVVLCTALGSEYCSTAPTSRLGKHPYCSVQQKRLHTPVADPDRVASNSRGNYLGNFPQIKQKQKKNQPLLLSLFILSTEPISLFSRVAHSKQPPFYHRGEGFDF